MCQLTNVKPLTERERSMHWEEVEELNAAVCYKGKFYTANTDNSSIIFICEEKVNPADWKTLQNGSRFLEI